MDTAKDNMIYAIGMRDDGTTTLACGVTEQGMDALRHGFTLDVDVPDGMRNVSFVQVFFGVTAAKIEQRILATGVPVERVPTQEL